MGYQPSMEEDSPLKQKVSNVSDLLAFFHESCKNPEDEMIGAEVELHGIHTDTYKPVTYLEKNGMRSLQNRLIEEMGWKIDKQEGKYIISMSRGGAHFSLESSEAMGEFASRVHSSLHNMSSELRLEKNELLELSRSHNIAWLGIGYQPFSPVDEIRNVKIKRYLISGEAAVRLKGRSDDYSWSNIASVQTNVDFTSEKDAGKKFQTLLRLAPLMSAMYSHAPLRMGKDSKFISYRTHIFRDIYPWRSGIRESFFKKGFNFKDWTEFCMEVPMVAIFRGQDWIQVKNRNFSQFLNEGYEGFTPILEDWVIHLSYIYTDARIKNYIELRVCDSLPPVLVPSVNALTKAFVYHPDGEEAIKAITKKWTFEDFNEVYEKIAQEGMEAEVQGKRLIDYCKEVLEIASEFLFSFQVLNEQKEDESIYLKPIKHFVFVEGKSPGAWVRDQWNGPWKQNPEKLIEWCTSDHLNYGNF
ncbi:MAG: hypothetical protein ACD_28C00145G0011 [uncultured bacterium]|nr:MAG: hypothetical protein ACD_28C00145G0011 [uncultured bacterium]KKT75780.1 MAG: Glutamate-cysteine ligase, (Gamma-glutamylcysteine synthetase) [Candidatus Peregrinibacteria bacterium GW2011_GWA2_44_7]